MPTQFSQFNVGGNLQAGDTVAGLRNNLNTMFTIPNVGGTVQITQNAHGFLVGQLIYIDAASHFALANANAFVTSNVIGIVSSIIDANNFILQYIGLTPTIVPQVNPPIAALIPGTVYYLSDAVNGSYTNIPPITPGHVLKPVFIAFTADTAFIFNYQGNIL